MVRRGRRAIPHSAGPCATNNLPCVIPGAESPVNVKKIVSWLLLAFVVFFIVTSPSNAATVVHNIWHGLTLMARGGTNFVDNL
jgi:hypothetical protein